MNLKPYAACPDSGASTGPAAATDLGKVLAQMFQATRRGVPMQCAAMSHRTHARLQSGKACYRTPQPIPNREWSKREVLPARNCVITLKRLSCRVVLKASPAIKTRSRSRKKET